MNERDLLLNAKGEALITRILLDELRAGRSANALELLEERLDTSVLMIDRFAQKGGPTERELVTATLRVVRDYRLRHPRKTEASIEDIEDDGTLGHAQDKVRVILDKVE
jgi:hypothetical protein